MSDTEKSVAEVKADDKQLEKDNAAEAARHDKAVKATTVDKAKIKAAVQAVLEDGANQHAYPHMLVNKVNKAIDDPDAYMAQKPSDGRDGGPSGPTEALVGEAGPETVEVPKKKKETKADKVARLADARAAKAKKKKDDAAAVVEHAAETKQQGAIAKDQAAQEKANPGSTTS
jgi:hypothetical protein